MSDSDDMVVVHPHEDDVPNELNESNGSVCESLLIISNGSPTGSEPRQEGVSPEREDITQALEVVSQVKNAIQYHDDEAMQNALDKVKERPLIDETFSEKIQMLQRLRNTENYSYFHPCIDVALESLRDVQERAISGKTSLNRPIEILNEVLPVFEKACSIYMEKLELCGVVNKNLSKCDQLRTQIKAIMLGGQDVEEIKRLEKECDKLLEQGVHASKADIERIQEKLKEEHDADILSWFESTRSENCEKMDYLISDFQQMNENCVEDIQLIEQTLNLELESKETALGKFSTKDEELAEKIGRDLETEEELKEQLRKVQEHRQVLQEERQRRKDQQERADVVHQQAEGDLDLLLTNLSNLRAKVDTADVVLRQTRDVCNKLFDKAVESKTTKNHDLDNLLIQSKDMSHTALIAQAINCKSTVESQKGTVTYLNEKINKRKAKLQSAVKCKLATEVKGHQQKLKTLNGDLEASKKVVQKNEEKLKKLMKDTIELEEVLKDAGVEYETFSNAFERFNKQEEGNDGYSLTSIP